MEYLEFGKAKLIGTSPRDSWRVKKPEINQDLCKKCGMCVDYCIEGCMQMGNEGVIINYRLCKGCGVCANECPTSAIRMID